MRYIVLITLMCLCFGCTGTRYIGSVETATTLQNWGIAREYQAQGRFEMARQYYTLALAAARTPEAQCALQQEIEAADRQVQVLR